MDELEMQVVANSALFQGIPLEGLDLLFPHLAPRRAVFEGDVPILESGQTVCSLGLVLSGRAHVVREDLWGGRVTLEGLLPGDAFAEAQALLPGSPLEVSILAVEPTVVLFLNLEPVARLRLEEGVEEFRRLSQNLLTLLARKNLVLERRAEILSKRTVRNRVLSYLSAESLRRESPRFEIPFSRQELADLLSVNRCALSTEISRLREEGIVACRGRTFAILRGQ